ncbi:hypothetical protein [Nonomuraea wenchangensis]|uniref:hypothetical protein n=1 Tax=Nonomuraea wenchangensis TaxID=568860 RepID=UPI0015A56366|nr:hypothetical protein [Nonomuraea wenchangensis]
MRAELGGLGPEEADGAAERAGEVVLQPEPGEQLADVHDGHRPSIRERSGGVAA